MYARFIQKLRKKHNFTQENMAKTLEISRPTYSQIEQGQRDITVTEAKKLATIFDLSFEAFFQQQDIETKIELIENKKKVRRQEMRISIPQEQYNKFKQVLLYILKKVGGKPNIGMTALYKILYFIDFDYYEKYEEQLMGLRYIKNHFGPTPKKLFSKLVEELVKDKVIQVMKTNFHYQQIRYILIDQDIEPDLTIINGQEKEHIDKELTRLSDLTANQLSILSHKDVPWITAKEGEELDYEAVFYRTAETSVRDYNEQQDSI
jgi:transcriptional regulator with XRE-family HTH domain